MAKRKFILEDPDRSAAPSNDHTRGKIEAALLALMAEGEKLTHDAAAARAGVSRRTAYRYFPDQQALREATWKQLSPPAGMPDTLESLLAGIGRTFATFDEQAAVMTVATASAEGRAMRNAMKPERVRAFRSAYGEVTAALPEPDRTWAIAAMQLMTSGLAWCDMRDQWDMDGPAIAAATRWAIEAMLADLARRGDRPLAEGAAD